MTTDKFQDDHERAERIDYLLDERIAHAYGSDDEAARALADRMGWTVGTARTFIIYIGSPTMVYENSSGRMAPSEQPAHHRRLHKISVFYELLGLDPSDEIVALTSEINPHIFRYPPGEFDEVRFGPLVEIDAPWTGEQINFVLKCRNDPKYRKLRNMGAKIADDLEARFGVRRTPSAVRQAYYKNRKGDS